MTDRYGISGYFDAVQGMPSTLAEGKLSGATEILKRFSLQGPDTLMIGDSCHDAEIARHLGVDCILVSAGHQAASRLSRHGFPVADSLAHLARMLDFGPSSKGAAPHPGGL